VSESDSSDAAGPNNCCPSSWTLSSADAGSDGEVLGNRDRGLMAEFGERKGASRGGGSSGASRDCSVGRLGVDLDWKPEGTGLPLLLGGMSLSGAGGTAEPHVNDGVLSWVHAWPAQ
jgi:hypothetical protein